MSARLAVEETFQCPVEHLRSEFVMEGLSSASVWEGTVEVFAISQPPPEIVFTWAVMGDKGPEWLIIPESAADASPALAVRNWMKKNGD